MPTTGPTAPTYRFFSAQVARTRRLAPSWTRITLTGTDLAGFGVAGFDQRITLALPAAGRSVVELPRGDDWYAAWLAAPETGRPVLRTYTVRATRPEPRELDLDVVLHGSPAGPAATWAAHAEPGDRVALVGPGSPGTGRGWGVEWAPPPGATSVLLAGDETAVPAISAVLEALPDDARATALLEVPTTDDVLELAAPVGVRVRWLPRDGAPHGSRLAPALHDAVPGAPGAARTVTEPDPDLLWEVPEQTTSGGRYAWLAGEAGMVRDLRRHLVGAAGMDRSEVAFMGYWRAGRSG